MGGVLKPGRFFPAGFVDVWSGGSLRLSRLSKALVWACCRDTDVVDYVCFFKNLLNES